MAAVDRPTPRWLDQGVRARARPPCSSPSRSVPGWPRRPWPPPSTGGRGRPRRVRCPTAPRSPWSPPTPTPAGRCCATRRPTCWPRPCCGCGRRRTSPSVRSSRTASTTTSNCPVAPTSPTRTSSASTAEMREIMAEDQPFVRHEHSIDEGLALFGDQPFKREIIEAVGAGQDEVDAAAEDAAATGVSTYWNSPTFTDLCRGPHVPPTSRARSLRPDAGGRRLLAGRREAPAAAAHLRYGLGVRRGRWPSTSTVSRRPRRRDHRKLGAELDLFSLPRGDRLRARRVPPQGAASSASSWRTTPASATRRLATSSCTPRTSPRPSSSRPRATSTGSPRGCTRPWSSTAGSSTTSSP